MRFLDKVELAFTCPLAWEKLTGGDRERHCEQCNKHVTNLSSMSREDAAAWLKASPGPICVRVEVDDRGRSVHRPSLGMGALSLSLVASPVHSCQDQPTEVVGGLPAQRDIVDPIPVGPALMGEPPALVPEVNVEPPPIVPPPVPPVHALVGRMPVRHDPPQPPHQKVMGKVKRAEPVVETMGLMVVDR